MRRINVEIFQKSQKDKKMKKFFAIAVIAASFVACNNSGDKTETTDTTKAPVVDTPAVVVDTPAVKVDSPAVVVDTPAVEVKK